MEEEKGETREEYLMRLDMFDFYNLCAKATVIQMQEMITGFNYSQQILYQLMDSHATKVVKLLGEDRAKVAKDLITHILQCQHHITIAETKKQILLRWIREKTPACFKQDQAN